MYQLYLIKNNLASIDNKEDSNNYLKTKSGRENPKFLY